MIITNRHVLEKFIKKHAIVKEPMNRFIETLERHEIKNHNQLLEVFSSADYVGNNRYCFDIKGNNYRVILLIVFVAGVARVRFVNTHAEYTNMNKKIGAKNV